MYPNPTTGLVNITGTNNATVTVFNTTGAIVAEYNNFNSGQIDLTNLNEGIYFLSIVIDNKTTLNKKISVLK
ncbi:MAG: T9SS type A sorting domain-containing protein [Bacteroidetes bacterium]|nr:T9SS type A sorting domain-containing protein [Bacteroidota bacterium]